MDPISVSLFLAGVGSSLGGSILGHRQNRPGDRPCRVDGVEHADARRDAPSLADRDPDHDRKGHADEHGRHERDDKGQCETDAHERHEVRVV